MPKLSVVLHITTDVEEDDDLDNLMQRIETVLEDSVDEVNTCSVEDWDQR